MKWGEPTSLAASKLIGLANRTQQSQLCWLCWVNTMKKADRTTRSPPENEVWTAHAVTNIVGPAQILLEQVVRANFVGSSSCVPGSGSLAQRQPISGAALLPMKLAAPHEMGCLNPQRGSRPTSLGAVGYWSLFGRFFWSGGLFRDEFVTCCQRSWHC